MEAMLSLLGSYLKVKTALKDATDDFKARE